MCCDGHATAPQLVGAEREVGRQLLWQSEKATGGTSSSTAPCPDRGHVPPRLGRRDWAGQTGPGRWSGNGAREWSDAWGGDQGREGQEGGTPVTDEPGPPTGESM